MTTDEAEKLSVRSLEKIGLSQACMRVPLRARKDLRVSSLLLLMAFGSGLAEAKQDAVYFLRLPERDAKTLGAVDMINVSVSCGWISGLKNVPELYDIEMVYDVPTTNMLKAEPRLGAAAVDLSKWDGVIGVRLPQNADAKSCFKVEVMVGGRSGETRVWTGRELGLP